MLLHKHLNFICRNTDKFIDKRVYRDPGIYLVLFTVLNKEKSILVYNYINYNSIFIYYLFVYLKSKCNFGLSGTLRQWRDFFTIIDYDLHISPVLI